MKQLINAEFVVDASAFIFRAYYALQPLSSKGRPSHAVAGFISMLCKLLREYAPKTCVVVFDSKTPTFRKELYAEYKANRTEPPPDISEQIQAVMKFCEAADLPVLQQDGVEADDWIASFVKQIAGKDPVAIVSSDKDLAQLVSERVVLFDSFRGKTLGPAEVEEKWGVKPNQMRDYLSLIGDASDNIPGVSGIGPKTAQSLIAEHGSKKEIQKHFSSLNPKMRSKLEASQKDWDLSYDLVGLKEDLPVPFSEPPKLSLPFPKAAREFLIDWDCHRLMESFPEFFSASKEIAPKVESRNEPQFRIIDSSADLQALKKNLPRRIAFDVETNSFDRLKAKIVGFSLCWSPEEAFYIPVLHSDQKLDSGAALEFLRSIVESEEIEKVGHNLKYEFQALQNEGFQLCGKLFDTMVLAHLVKADRRSYSLASLSEELLGRGKPDLKELLKGSEDFSHLNLSEALPYAANDAFLTWALFEQFLPQIEKDAKLSWLYEEVEAPLVCVLGAMESLGIKLDCDRLKELQKKFSQDLLRINAEIYKLAGGEFNIQSPKQLQSILFEKLKLTPSKKTKTGYSTDESVLQELAFEHPLPKLILESRGLSKLVSTYVEPLQNLVDERSRLHTHYHQTGTATGRLSSSEPNLQNIPVRTDEGMMIRSAFVAEDGHLLLSADYSQIELRLFAHFSEDPQMLKAFREGRDIHSETAKLIFGSDDKEFRSRAKAINFGIIYGISAFGLSRQLGISRTEAQKFLEAYFEQFPRAQAFMKAAVEKARENGYSETLFGRKRPLADINSKNPSLRQFAERIAINAPLQGTAADLMKVAMVRLFSNLKKRGLKTKLLLQVHDEVICEVPKNESEEAEALVRESLLNFSGTPGQDIFVPLEVDLRFGAHWAEI